VSLSRPPLIALGVLALAACGSSAHPAATPQGQPVTADPTVTASLTLTLRGGSNASLTACGRLHHYRVYEAGTTIRYSGTVTPVPSGHWKVKLKIKVCTGGVFVDMVKVQAIRDKHTGAFAGSFPAPAAGDYEARAELYVADVRAARSRKSHFSIS
jgi:hypothetical protein